MIGCFLVIRGAIHFQILIAGGPMGESEKVMYYFLVYPIYHKITFDQPSTNGKDV
jgi:hypothetical protein